MRINWRPGPRKLGVRAGRKPSDLEFRSRLLDNWGGEKQTTRMRDSSVQASQIDFLSRRAWAGCVPHGKRENF
jgi:hypothetical protein